MSTIITGVDASERSEDAIAFAGRMAEAANAHVVVANAYPYSDTPGRAANAAYREALREDALRVVRDMRAKLPEERSLIRVTADPSPPKALHHLAHAENASLLVVGSTHTGRAGRVLPGSTGERLLHGAPCSVAVVPTGYREHAAGPIRRIGVAYDETAEAKAAVAAAVAVARALDAELEVIGVVSSDYVLTGDAEGLAALREVAEKHVTRSLEAVVERLPVAATARRLTGDPAELLAARSSELDLLVMGSRGYGPLHAVLVGGVSGRVLREAQCPVIVVPRGIDAPLESLFGELRTGSAA